jgi:hypothetical protein
MVDFAKLRERHKEQELRRRKWPIHGLATERLVPIELELDVLQGQVHKPNCSLVCLPPWDEVNHWCDCGLWGEPPTWW